MAIDDGASYSARSFGAAKLLVALARTGALNLVMDRAILEDA
jgi:hypothetical protein